MYKKMRRKLNKKNNNQIKLKNKHLLILNKTIVLQKIHYWKVKLIMKLMKIKINHFRWYLLLFFYKFS